MADNHLLQLIKINDTWNRPRSPVPLILVDEGVTEELWNATYDSALKHQSEFVDMNREIIAKVKKRAIFILIVTCTALVLFFSALFNGSIWLLAVASMMTISLGVGSEKRAQETKKEHVAHILKWQQFIEAETRKYGHLGIKLKMVNGQVRGGGASKKLIIGGIMFSKVGGGATNSNSSSLVRDLESLNSLHQSGALSLEEYTAAKARVLGQQVPSVPIASPVEVETAPHVAFAVATNEEETVCAEDDADEKGRLLELV